MAYPILIKRSHSIWFRVPYTEVLLLNCKKFRYLVQKPCIKMCWLMTVDLSDDFSSMKYSDYEEWAIVKAKGKFYSIVRKAKRKIFLNLIEVKLISGAWLWHGLWCREGNLDKNFGKCTFLGVFFFTVDWSNSCTF